MGYKDSSDSFWCESIISATKYFTLPLSVQRDVLIAFIRVVCSLMLLSLTVFSNTVLSRFDLSQFHAPIIEMCVVWVFYHLLYVARYNKIFIQLLGDDAYPYWTNVF